MRINLAFVTGPKPAFLHCINSLLFQILDDKFNRPIASCVQNSISLPILHLLVNTLVFVSKISYFFDSYLVLLLYVSAIATS